MNSWTTISLEEMRMLVHSALSGWDNVGGAEEEHLAALLLVRERMASLGGPDTPLARRRAIHLVIEEALAELAVEDEIGASILRARFLKGQIVRQVAQTHHASVDQVNRWQRAALGNLARILFSHEVAIREARIGEHLAALPPATYTKLFGLEKAHQTIVEQLVQPDGARIVAIVGIGGIGKTSLAHSVAHHLLQANLFERAIWLPVRILEPGGGLLQPDDLVEALITALYQQLWPDRLVLESPYWRELRLFQALKARPHLVILDNLEVEATVSAVSARFARAVDPSCFLLTSRVRPSVHQHLFTYALEELSFEETASLLRYQAMSIGLAELSQAPAADIEAIYAVTGGNPLALKLVASLATVLPLPQVLDNLGRGRSSAAEELYRHIYWEAWRTLSQPARDLLQSAPLIPAGILLEQLQVTSGLAEDNFWSALQELVARSLLAVQGTLRERRYGIHQLTKTFLRTKMADGRED